MDMRCGVGSADGGLKAIAALDTAAQSPIARQPVP